LAPRFEVPTVPLGETIGLEVFDGLEIGLQEADFQFNSDNWLLLGGKLEAFQ